MLGSKKRVFLTISGIIIGIFVFSFFLFASSAIEDAVNQQFSSLGLNVLFVQSIESQGGGPPSGSGLTNSDVLKIKQVTSGVKYVAPQIFFSDAQYEFGREKEYITTLGIEDKNLENVQNDLGIKIEAGRQLRAKDRSVL